MGKKRTKKTFDAAAAYTADPSDETMGQGDPTAGQGPNGPSAGGGDPSGGGDQSAGGGQDLTIPGQVVAQLEQLKQSGNMQTLGQVVAQLLP